MAKLLFDRGYRKVRPLLGGYDGWKAAGLPVEFLTIQPKLFTAENAELKK